jgi:hypothetical protein
MVRMKWNFSRPQHYPFVAMHKNAGKDCCEWLSLKGGGGDSRSEHLVAKRELAARLLETEDKNGKDQRADDYQEIR